jgi:hypothetical protein
MKRKGVIILVIVDCLIVAAVCGLYLAGAFTGVGYGWIGVAISLPILLNLVFVSEYSSIRFLEPQESLSIFPTSLQPDRVLATVPRVESKEEKTDQTAKLGVVSAIGLILLFAFVAYFTKSVPLNELSIVVVLGASVTVYGFSLQGNFWRPRWADADPGINVLRCLIVGMLCVAASADVFWGIEAWFGTLDHNVHREFLKLFSGLAMVGYYARRLANRPNP